MLRGGALFLWLWVPVLAAAAVSKDKEPRVRLEALKAELAKLPKPLVGPFGGTLGYASELLRVSEKQSPKWVLVDLGRVREIDAVALAPSWMIGADRLERAHGFPKRFRVETAEEASFSDARVAFDSGGGFPDPGRNAVWLDVVPHRARYVRVVATDLRGSFFGLSELFVFSGERNVALGARVAALDRIGSNLNWSPAHLTDGYSTLGLPTGEASNRRGCFRSAPLSSESEPSWLEVRLLEEQELSAISLVPAAWIPNLARIQHLGEGFPAAFRIEVASGDGPWVGVFEHRAEERPPFPNPCNVMWSLALPEGIRADRIRITATRHVYNEVASAYYFALGEVQVLDGAGRNVALGARVECAHPGRDGNAFRVENAVDGFSSDGSLMGLREWLKALNRRRVVQLEIADLETALREWMLRRERTWRSLGWGAGLAVSGAAGLHFWGLRRGRLRREAALRERIAQDLHDEIGSTLGSISLYADGLARRASGPDQGRLAQVAEMAREASQTMRDLVWVVDERSDDSGQLFERLRETAMRQVADMPLQFEAPEGEKAVRVSPDQKRHLLLFLKEALHNVIRHAAASQVRVRIESEGAYWVLEVGDDGRGFEPECPGGSQLEKLRARAARLGGQLEVESRRGAGTRLRLRIPCRIADA